jgi:hypothetical protein
MEGAPMTRSSDKLTPLIPALVPLLRMLGSGADGEIVNSVRILRQKLDRGGTDIHALVDRLEKPQALSASASDMQREFERGRAAGRAEMITAAASHGGKGVGQGVNGYSWLAIAKHLQAHASQLPTKFEREFCGSIATQLRYHPPSAKQAAVLHRIFVNRFGGRIS